MIERENERELDIEDKIKRKMVMNGREIEKNIMKEEDVKEEDMMVEIKNKDKVNIM